MSSRENTPREAQKDARPPEYTIIRRQASARGAPQPSQQIKKSRQSKLEARFEESETRREQRREERYRSKRRRQWILSAVIVVVFIGLLALALHLLTSSSTSTPGAPNPGGSPSTGATLSVRF
ncbi:MAG TPA: hypothetical protein VFU69_08250 [Ktedonobacterales bacterium]|nr:hypothetical protein [Ktedonobacterales bacterium]